MVILDMMKRLCHNGGYCQLVFAVVITTLLSSSGVAAPVKPVKPGCTYAVADIKVASSMVDSGGSLRENGVYCGEILTVSLLRVQTLVSAVQVGVINQTETMKLAVDVGEDNHQVTLLPDEGRKDRIFSVDPPCSGLGNIVIHTSPPTSCVTIHVWSCEHSSGSETPSSTSTMKKDSFHNHDGLSHVLKRRAVDDAPGHTTTQSYSLGEMVAAGTLSVAVLGVLVLLVAVSICCNDGKRKVRTRDKDLIVPENLPPFESSNNPMKVSTKEAEFIAERTDSIDPLGVPTTSTFQRSSIDKFSLDAKPPPLQEPFVAIHKDSLTSSLAKSPRTESTLYSPAISDSLEHFSVSSLTQQQTHSHPSTHQSAVSDELAPGNQDRDITSNITTFKAIQRAKDRRSGSHSNTRRSRNDSCGSGISYVLTPNMLARLSLESSSGVQESLREFAKSVEHIPITHSDSQGHSCGSSNSKAEEKVCTVSTTVVVNQPLLENKSVRPTSGVIVEREPRPVRYTRAPSDADRLQIDETSLDKGTRMVIPSPTPKSPGKQEYSESSLDRKNRARKKKKKSRPRSPPTLPPLPPPPAESEPNVMVDGSEGVSSEDVRGEPGESVNIEDVIVCSNCGQELPKTTDLPPSISESGENTSERVNRRSAPQYHIVKPGCVICRDCMERDGPIYHQLEPLSDHVTPNTAPPLPPRERSPKPAAEEKDPVYERVGSLKESVHPLRANTMVAKRTDFIDIGGTRKPNTLPMRNQSSTDYESIPSLGSPIYHKVVTQLGTSLPLPVKPCNDYETPTNIVLTKEVGGESHDYAYIGDAPSMEDLSATPTSPPFVPEGAVRAQMLKIDSQGYASVIRPSLPDDDDYEIDCLTFSERNQCPVGLEMPVCVDNDNDPGYAPLTPRSSKFYATDSQRPATSSAEPQDYEVPVNCLPTPPPSVSPQVLRRQSALESTSESSEGKRESRRLSSHLDRSSEEERQYSRTIFDHEESEDVFDSGIENSGGDLSLTPKHRKPAPPTKPKPQHKAGGTSRSVSFGDGSVSEDDKTSNRQRAMTVHSSKNIASHGRQGSNTALHISLDQNLKAIV